MCQMAHHRQRWENGQWSHTYFVAVPPLNCGVCKGAKYGCRRPGDSLYGAQQPCGGGRIWKISIGHYCKFWCKFYVHIESLITQKMLIDLYDVTGKFLQKKEMLLNAGNNIQPFTISSLASGVYFLQADKIITQPVRILKQ